MKLNYARNIENNEQVNEIFSAIEWEKCDMMIAMNNDAISAKESIIANKKGTYTDAEVEAAKSAKVLLEAANDELRAKQEEVSEIREKVLSAITSAKSEDGNATNDVNAVRNILRLSACSENKKFFRLAPVSCPALGTIYEAMEKIHSFDGDFSADGERINYAISKEAFKTVSKEVEKALRSMYSIFVENEYTQKISVRFNKTDLGHIHECYVRNFEVKTYKKDGEVVITGGAYKTIITKKETEKGVEYDGKSFFELISKLAFLHLFK